MSDVAVEATEAAMEHIEEAVDGIVEVVEVVRSNPKVVVAAGVVGLIAGGVGGYFFARKTLRAEFEQLASEEIADAKEFYANLNKVDSDGVFVSPQDVLLARQGEEAVAAVREYQGRDDDHIEVEPAGEPHDDILDEELLAKTEKKVRHTEKVDTPFGEATVVTETDEKVNVFVDDTFDLEEEQKYRTPEKPYIITHDEFFAAEKDYDTQSLTYYEMDDTLTDEHDKPIEKVEQMIGEDHLVRFGSGSKDKNIVYIRNERLEVDYDVTKSTGSYLEEVLGMPDDEPGTLKHSNREAQQRRRREFRHGDE